jgi:hypothetical protein
MMKFAGLAAPAILLFALAAPAAEAASLSGSPAFALAALVAAHSPLLSADQKKAIAAFFDGKSGTAYKGKIEVGADKIVCRASNVDITARSCELSFGKKTASFTGREANELYSTEAMAGIASDGAAGSSFESLSKLKCTLDPEAIQQKDGSGAQCSYEAAN